MLKNLAFKDLSHESLRGAIKVVGILVFRIILRIYYKSCSKYLAMKNIARSIAEDSGLRAKPKVKSF